MEHVEPAQDWTNTSAFAKDLPANTCVPKGETGRVASTMSNSVRLVRVAKSTFYCCMQDDRAEKMQRKTAACE